MTRPEPRHRDGDTLTRPRPADIAVVYTIISGQVRQQLGDLARRIRSGEPPKLRETAAIIAVVTAVLTVVALMMVA
jgi:hypothetical protein